jgi:hypothetical protein
MKLLITALLVGTSFAAFAQNSLSNVTGNVTISSNGTTSKAGSDSVLKNGDVVAASSASGVTIKVGGCTVSLLPGQSLVIDASLPCDRLSASVKSLNLPGQPGGFQVANYPGGPVGLGATIIGGGLIVRELTKKNKASGS